MIWLLTVLLTVTFDFQTCIDLSHYAHHFGTDDRIYVIKSRSEVDMGTVKLYSICHIRGTFDANESSNSSLRYKF